jgi:hypothetical protein
METGRQAFAEIIAHSIQNMDTVDLLTVMGAPDDLIAHVAMTQQQNGPAVENPGMEDNAMDTTETGNVVNTTESEDTMNTAETGNPVPTAEVTERVDADMLRERDRQWEALRTRLRSRGNPPQ